MCNENYMEESDNSQEAELHEEYVRLCSLENFTKWLYENYSIHNGHDLVMLTENYSAWEKYMKDVGLPITAELGD